MSNRLLWISAPFPPAQVPEADHALHECLHLAEMGYEVHVVTTRRPGLAAPAGLTMHPVMERWTWGELLRIWRLARELRPAVTIVFFAGWLYDYRTMVTVAPRLVKLASPECRTIAQFSALGQGGKIDGSWKSRMQRFLFRVAGRYRYGTLLTASDRVVVFSGVHGRRLKEIYPAVERKTVLVPPPPLLPFAPGDTAAAGRRGRHRLGIADDEFLVTYFSRIYPGKGLENLLEAAAALAPTRPRLRLAIVGGYMTPDAWFTRRSYPEELEATVADLGLGDRVVWSGEYQWDSTEASEYLYGSDLVALPFGLGVYLYNSSFGAALAHGAPVIATRGEVVEDPIVHGENVYLVPPHDSEALARAIETLMDNDGLRTTLSNGARALADEWFSWDKATPRILGVAAD